MVSTIRLPYGAMELKRVYQRHMLMGTGAAATLTVLGLFFAWLYTMWSGEDRRIINLLSGNLPDSRLILTIGPPPIAYDRPRPAEPETGRRKAAIITPMDAEKFKNDGSTVMANGRRTAWGSPALHGLDEERLGIGNTLPQDMFFPMEMPPVLIHEVLPEYPNPAREEGVTGSVTLHVYIDKNGVVRKVQVAACTLPAKGFEEAATKAAYLAQYCPGIQNGVPVGVWISYQVQFRLEG